MGGGLEVLKYGDPRLQEVCLPVTEDDLRVREVRELIEGMSNIVLSGPLIAGLAANQVGYNLRIIIVNLQPRQFTSQFTPIINPEFTHISPSRTMAHEGCLSLPRGKHLFRAKYVSVRGLNPSGEELTLDLSNLNARILQHEVDHLNGILVRDRSFFGSLFGL